MSLLVRRSVAATVVIAAVTAVGRSPGSPPAAEGLSIARAYLGGMNAGEIAALDRLFPQALACPRPNEVLFFSFDDLGSSQATVSNCNPQWVLEERELIVVR